MHCPAFSGRSSGLSGSAVLFPHSTSGGVGRLQLALLSRRRPPDCCEGNGWVPAPVGEHRERLLDDRDDCRRVKALVSRKRQPRRI